MRIQLRRGTAAQWAADNPVLGAGEPGWVSDTQTLKFGDGVTAFASLPAFGASSAAASAFPLAGYGLLAASDNPNGFMSVSALGNNTLFETRVWIPAGVAITNLWCAVRDAGVHDGVTAGSCLALATDAGVLVDTTTPSNALWTANGWRGGALSAGVVAAQAAGRFVYITPLAKGMTTPANIPFPTSASDTQVPWFDTGVGVTNRRCMIIGAAAIPASFDPTSAGAATTFLPLLGVS